MIPDYASCEKCGECDLHALRKDGPPWLCFNCGDSRHKRRGDCEMCRRTNVPLEGHHIAGERHAPERTPLCLNCHSIENWRQYRWGDAWRTGCRPAFYTLRGKIDLVCLWFERSPAPSRIPARYVKWVAMLMVVLALLRVGPVRDRVLGLMAEAARVGIESICLDLGLTAEETAELLNSEF